MRVDYTAKEHNIDDLREQAKYSAYSIVAEIARYLNKSCILIDKILNESSDGISAILEYVNRYNEILYDVIIPKIFKALFEVKGEIMTEKKEVVLLREPKDSGYYEFSASSDLVITQAHNGFRPDEIAKSFHADTYCFDSKPELELFLQYITSKKVKEIYFTGMFTSNQGNLSVQYYDPESHRIRHYYPDFLAKMSDDTYQLIEVKGDNKLDDTVVQAKKDAAVEMSTASGMVYKMFAGSTILKQNVLDTDNSEVTQAVLI